MATHIVMCAAQPLPPNFPTGHHAATCHMCVMLPSHPCQVNSSNPPPFTAPDFILATPAGLKTLLDEAGASYGRLWTEEGLQARAHVRLTPSHRCVLAMCSHPFCSA